MRIILDTSVIVAIILREPLANDLYKFVAGADAAIAAPNLLEAHLVLRPRLEALALPALDRLRAKLAMTVLPFGEPEFTVAAEAFDRFGKGRNPARLNYGDCMAYAASRTSGRTLLFVGEDFTLTDVARVQI